MNVPLVFVAFIVSLLTIYMMNRFVKRPGLGSVFVLLAQFLSATVITFSLFEDVLTTPEVELSIIIGGVFLPSAIVIYDYVKMIRKVKEQGINIRIIEPKARNNAHELKFSYFTENVELYKGELDALTVFKSLNIQDKDISKNIKRQLILAQKLIRLQRYNSAAMQYRFLLSVFPKSILVAYNAGYLNCFVGKYREAYKILDRARELLKQEQKNHTENKEILPDQLEAMIQFNLGYALYNSGRFEQSIKCFEKVTDINPDLTVAYKNIARAYLAINMEDKAIEYLEKGRLDLRDSLLRIVLGSIYYKNGETRKALEVLDEIVASETKQIDALKYKGKAALKEKIFDKAEECFEKLIELEPSEPLNYYHLALSQRELKRDKEALKTYERGISVISDNSMLFYNAATLLDEMGDKERAVHYLYKSLEGDELLEDAYNYLGVLLGQLGRYREAVQVFDRGIKVFESSYRLYFNRGIVLEMSRRLEDAALSFAKAYELNQQDQVLIYNYAAVLIKLRRYTEAMQIYKTSLTNYPEDAELYYGMSKVYAQMGEKDLAVDLLRKVLESDPSYKSKITRDTSFKTLCKHEGYKSLIAS
ncbi:MAG: tetratricopeptide repeat protein [Clostridiaceae bacterium]|nr:tetratricopeptide repeat protein [Clostridiaceae bacterium]